MSNMPNMPVGADPVATFEFARMQLCGSLNAVAAAMRDAANFADQFATLVRDIPYHPGHPGFVPPNGQFLQLPPPPAPAPAGGKRKLRDGEEVTDGKKKRKTKPKDPNAPKRPPSSYLMFQNDVRQEIKAKHPNLPNNELLAMISRAWNDMPKEKKDTYEERQKLAKNHYLSEKASYEKGLGNPDAPSPPATPADVEPPSVVKPAEVSEPTPEVPVVTSSEEESSDNSSSESDSEESEEEDAPPPPTKKSKQPSAPAISVKTEKGKKHKKNKA